MAAERFLLCRPQGGLNDNLTQIEKCWRYAEQHRRTLIIDTSASSGFMRPFGDCFRPVKSLTRVITQLTPELLEKLEKLDTFPKCVQGKLNGYKPLLWMGRNFVDSTTKEDLSFDFGRDYEEQLILHDQCGGDVISLHGLARLKLAPELKADVLELLAPLKHSDYVSIHIRNTDYETDYKSFFDWVKPKVSNSKILVCSDSAEVIEYARHFFSGSEVLSLGELPQTDKLRPHYFREVLDVHAQTIEKLPMVGLHHYSQMADDQARYKLFVRTIADLIGLAGARALFICRLKVKAEGFSGVAKSSGIGGFSGFSLLAANLQKSRAILSQLLTD